MPILEMKKHKDKFEINLYHKKGSRTYYHVIIDRDPKKLAQVFMDLYLEGYPIERAFKDWRERTHKKDWLGV